MRSSALSEPMRELRPPARMKAEMPLFAVRLSLFARAMDPTLTPMLKEVNFNEARHSAARERDGNSGEKRRGEWRRAKRTAAPLRVRRIKRAGLGKAAIDLDGYDASCLIQFQRGWYAQHGVAAQARQGDKHPVLNAGGIRVALQKGKRMLVAAVLGQHEGQVRDIAGFGKRDGNFNRDAGAHFVAVNLDCRLEADVVLETRLRIEGASIDLKRHSASSEGREQLGIGY